jgi:thioredoxin-related protein
MAINIPAMKWLALAALLLAAPAHAQEPPTWFAPSLLDLREDLAEAAKEGRRLMVYFHQDGCPYCKQLVEVNFRDPVIVATMRRHFMAIDVNIFGDREVTWTDGRRMPEKQFAALMKVRFTPTLVFFDDRGKIVHRIDGYLPPDRFLAALDAAAGKGVDRSN